MIGVHFVCPTSGLRHLQLATCPLQPADFRSLLARQDLCKDAIDAYLVGDGLRSARVVAGEHDDFDAHGVKLVNGLFGGWLDRVGHGDDAHRFAVDRYQHGGLGLTLQACDLLTQAIERNAVFSQQPGRSNQHHVSIHRCPNAAAGHRLERLRLGQRQSLRLSRLDNRLAQRMLGDALC